IRIARRDSLAPFKLVVAEETRNHILAEISVEAFVIEIWIALSALRSPVLRRLHRLSANLAVVVDERIAGIADLRTIEERKVNPSFRARQSTFFLTSLRMAFEAETDDE